ncbi:ribose 5-phosphate isomerase B [Streptomyces spinoverrucosus]|uniref:Ribose 5-phosphate isomerase B n=1 Tax=Streptomyces spinoverrucosus TaxID=284043 RepID=A0A4Y3VA30_9ACTN|nr:ribose 5-phosphate isomerase B [Streptomyces spinoverrucosus]GEC03215.1 ribose 5-phosphate isomerase B [Streptomyces spinoverrucosus]GHB37349.1 ribose 5-phosphate isomerase B [Streptomyces spinoverrucosus]
MRIAIAADHNGFALKARLISWLTAHGHTVDDRGSHTDDTVDYPPLCVDVCRRVADGAADRGIVLGGSGLGETIACNKIRGIRAGLCHDLWSTRISRGNNDSNVLVLAAKVLAPEAAEEIVGAWLSTPFNGGVHARRLEQISALER